MNDDDQTHAPLQCIADKLPQCRLRFVLAETMQIQTGFGPDLSLADPALQFGLHSGIEMGVARRGCLGRETGRRCGTLMPGSGYGLFTLTLLIDVDAVVTQSPDARHQAGKIGIIIVVHGVIAP